MEEAILLADKNSNSWSFAEKIKDYIRKHKQEELPLYHLPVSVFNNKELRIDPTENIRKRDVYFIHDSTKDPQYWLVEILFAKDMVLSSSGKSFNLVLPDMCFSRQDRKDKPRVPISARAVANAISPGTSRIITMDLHAAQIQGFYPATTPVDNLYSFPEVVRYIKQKYPSLLENLIITSPDAGGVARAESLMKRLQKIVPESVNFELALLLKKRLKAGVVDLDSIRYIGPDPKNRNFLLVDDIIDTGGTLCAGARKLKDMSAKTVSSYGCHGLFTKGLDELKKTLDYILVSNTHNIPFEGSDIIDVSPTFAEAIYRAQKGQSVSELFD